MPNGVTIKVLLGHPGSVELANPIIYAIDRQFDCSTKWSTRENSGVNKVLPLFPAWAAECGGDGVSTSKASERAASSWHASVVNSFANVSLALRVKNCSFGALGSICMYVRTCVRFLSLFVLIKIPLSWKGN